MPSHKLWHTPQAQLLTLMGLTVLEKEGTFEGDENEAIPLQWLHEGRVVLRF